MCTIVSRRSSAGSIQMRSSGKSGNTPGNERVRFDAPKRGNLAHEEHGRHAASLERLRERSHRASSTALEASAAELASAGGRDPLEAATTRIRSNTREVSDAAGARHDAVRKPATHVDVL